MWFLYHKVTIEIDRIINCNIFFWPTLNHCKSEWKEDFRRYKLTNSDRNVTWISRPDRQGAINQSSASVTPRLDFNPNSPIFNPRAIRRQVRLNEPPRLIYIAQFVQTLNSRLRKSGRAAPVSALRALCCIRARDRRSKGSSINGSSRFSKNCHRVAQDGVYFLGRSTM